ncbi:MAG: hypothetical protein JWM64_2268 [Frankiales bacterium]|nr:hypothetical protein [Frankiales bacterium]
MRTAALLALALVAGCSSAPDPVAPASDVGLSGRLIQYRDDLTRRYVQVEVSSSRPVQLLDVALRTRGFGRAPVRETGAQLTADDRVDLPVPYGAVRCDERPGADALLTVRTPDGRERAVRLPLADADALLGRLHAAECAEQDLREQVDLALGPALRVEGDAVLTSLVLTRRSGRARVSVPRLDGNIIFVETLAAPLVLEPEAERAETVLRAVAERCDAHALTESKQTGTVRVPVSVDGADPLLVRLVFPPDQARRLVQFATESCARKNPDPAH